MKARPPPPRQPLRARMETTIQVQWKPTCAAERLGLGAQSACLAASITCQKWPAGPALWAARNVLNGLFWLLHLALGLGGDSGPWRLPLSFALALATWGGGAMLYVYGHLRHHKTDDALRGIGFRAAAVGFVLTVGADAPAWPPRWPWPLAPFVAPVAAVVLAGAALAAPPLLLIAQYTVIRPAPAAASDVAISTREALSHMREALTNSWMLARGVAQQPEQALRMF